MISRYLSSRLQQLPPLVVVVVVVGLAAAAATTSILSIPLADGLMLTVDTGHRGRNHQEYSLVYNTASYVSSSTRTRRRRSVVGSLCGQRPTTTRHYQSTTESDEISFSAATNTEGQQQQQQQQQQENPSALVSLEELTEYASQEGIDLTFNTLGPGYRSVARFDPPTASTSKTTSTSTTNTNTSNDNDSGATKKTQEDNGSQSDDSRLVLGYVEGFVRPYGNILHLDKMEAYQPILNRAKRQYQRQYELAINKKSNKDDDQGTALEAPPPILYLGGISFGVGLLMGYQCLLYGKSKGCTRAEFLAIDDAPKQHRRLVKYYQRVGFQVVKYVGDDWNNVPDRLVWGGCGTLMTEDIDVLLEKWSKLIRLMKERSNDKLIGR